MNNLLLRLGAKLAAVNYGAREEHGQATVEYVGLVMVLGTGIGMVVAGLDSLGFVTKIGGKLVQGISSALGKIMP